MHVCAIALDISSSFPHHRNWPVFFRNYTHIFEDLYFEFKFNVFFFNILLIKNYKSFYKIEKKF